MSRRIPAPSGFLLAASLAAVASAQPIGHPCDDRTVWPSERSQDSPVYYAAAFDYLTRQSDKVKAIPNVARFFNELGVDPDRETSLDKTGRADKECVAAPDQEFFVQCDTVLNRAYVGVGKIALSQGRWLGAEKKEATL